MKLSVKRVMAFVITLVMLTCMAGCGDIPHENDAVSYTDAYVFAHSEGRLSIFDDGEAVECNFGYANMENTTFGCGNGRVSKTYYYDGFEVVTYEMIDDRKPYVASILMTGKEVSTAEGLSIGDMAEKVTELYGEGKADGYDLRFVKGDMELVVTCKDGTVTAIEYKEVEE